MEHLKQEIEGLLESAPNAPEVRERLRNLVSVYPFNEFEYIISTLLGVDVLSLDEYRQIRDQYIARSVIDLRNPHRAADAPAEVVLLVFAVLVLEEPAGIQRIVTEELISGSVEAIGAGLGGEGNHAALSAAEFRLEALGLHRRLRDGVHRKRVRVDIGPLHRVETAGENCDPDAEVIAVGLVGFRGDQG
ncbi:MAG: hypothetical protein HYR60_06220 [Acidobacteria bacterium]|nr:hypothetical protein [Acidobacteriota bacterium]